MSEVSLTIVDRISQEVGIPITDAEKIVGSFAEVAKGMSELDKELVKFNQHEEVTEEVCHQAREIRLKYKKVRTKGDEIHKAIKEGVLLRTKAIDGVRNIYKLKATEVETKLKDIELHFENIEQAKKDKVNAERELELIKYVEDVSMYNFKEMSDEAFENLIKTVKTAWDVEQEAIKKAEDDKIEAEKKEKEEQEKTRLENIKLKKEAEEKEAELAKEREAKEKELEAERLKAKKEAEEKARLQKEIDDKKAEDDRLAKEKADKEQADELARLQSEKDAELAPDKDKLLAFAKALEAIDVPELQTQEGKDTLSKALDFLGQTIKTLKIK